MIIKKELFSDLELTYDSLNIVAYVHDSIWAESVYGFIVSFVKIAQYQIGEVLKQKNTNSHTFKGNPKSVLTNVALRG